MKSHSFKRWVTRGTLSLSFLLSQCGGRVVTWQHSASVEATEGPVAPHVIRTSMRYAVRVAPVAKPEDMHTSFVYTSLPRSAVRQPSYDRVDGAEFAVEAGLTMSWSSFLYKEPVYVEIERIDGRVIEGTHSVTIRPTTLTFDLTQINPHTLRIRVPHTPDGFRFSVEFADDLITSYNDLQGITGRLSLEDTGRAIHTEPRHALLIFAEPLVTHYRQQRLIPRASDGRIYYPSPGEISDLNDVEADIIYFRPGLYWMPWNYHAHLPDSVHWVYLAPGAYVKGALEFGGARDNYRVTGYGILSGECYVYEADRRDAPDHVPYTQRSDAYPDCHGTGVKMLQYWSGKHPQRVLVHGVTVVEPPYHTFTAYGTDATFCTDFAHYKQVGGWYWQTDGVEIFPGGSLENSFLHANDDVIKLYHSDVSVRNVVVWKGENGPVFQWGWIPRTVQRVRVEQVDIIHNRMYWKDVKSNTGILNASTHWAGESQERGDARFSIEDIEFSGIRSEGMNLAAMRFVALANWRNIVIRDLWIEAWNELDTDSQQSLFRHAHSFENDQPVQLGNETRDGNGLRLINFRVGNDVVIKCRTNKLHHTLGRMNFDPTLWDAWDARAF